MTEQLGLFDDKDLRHRPDVADYGGVEMKDLFFRICVGCFTVLLFDYFYGFYCGLFNKTPDQFTRGFFGCLLWWIAVDSLKEMGWIK